MNPRLRSKFTPTALASLLGLAVIALPLAAQTRYTADDLGPVGSSVGIDPILSFGINASGQVAGYNSTPGSGVYTAIRYAGFSVTSLGALPGDTSGQAIAINDSGQIAGHSGNTTGTSSFLAAPQKVFLYNNGTFQILGSPANVAAINNAGQIVGAISGRAGIYTNGTLQLINTLGGSVNRAQGINSNGDVVGWSNTANNERHAFLYSGGVVRDLGTLGGATSQAQAINASGQIVGYGLAANGATHAFLYRDGTLSDLGAPTGETESRAYAINASGQIVGYIGGSANIPRAFIHAGGTFTDLNTLIPTRVAGTSGFSNLTFATAINDAGQIVGIGSYIQSGATSSTTHGFLLTPVPAVYPAALTASPGGTVAFASSTTLPGATYQWSLNGFAIAGATSASLVLPNISSAQTGFYACTVSHANARATSAASTLVVNSTATPGRIVNLAIRTSAGTGAQTLICGFAIGGAGTTGTKAVLIRGTGPALATFGVPGTLADPRIELFSGTTKLTENDNWAGDPQVTAIGAQVGAFTLTDPASKDAAIYRPALATGSYTVQVSGVGNTTGVALAEIYDATPLPEVTPATPRLINVSARAQVGTGGEVLIAGFVIGGSTAKTVLIRAVGPTLANFGVGSVLADPQLQLFQAATVIAANDNWGGDPQLATVGTSVGAFALGHAASKDAALLVTLPPGSYTAQVSGVGHTTGIALIEIYEVP